MIRTRPRRESVTNHHRQHSRSLSDDESAFLHREGYLVLDGILGPDQLSAFRTRLIELEREEGSSAGSVTQTPYSIEANRPQSSLRGKLSALCYRGLFRGVHAFALRWLFKYRPDIELRLRARSGSPRFGMEGLAASDADCARPNAFGPLSWLRRELLEMLTAAANCEPGSTRVCDLLNKDAMFDVCFQHGKVRAAVEQVIGSRMKVSSVNYRAAAPGGGLQPLHTDWEDPVEPDEYLACNTLWVLDDFTLDNGATRIVPGSQRSRRTPDVALDDPRAPHPEQELICAPAGSVIIMNSHAWHGGTLNRSDRRRRVIQSYFVERGRAQQLNQRRFLRRSTYERLTSEERWLLDVEGEFGEVEGFATAATRSA